MPNTIKGLADIERDHFAVERHQVSQSELWPLKSPRTTISERGDYKVMVSIDLER